MAEFSKYLPKLKRIEGGFVEHTLDKGGATMCGITLKTFQDYYGSDKTKLDLISITDRQIEQIYRDGYWDRCKADQIKNQSVAELLVDFAVNSGVKTAVKKIQALLRIPEDGILGRQTLEAINNKDSRILFNELHDVRVAYYKLLVKKNPSQKVFLNGWMHRLEYFTYNE